MKNILSFSGGKDSTAMLLMAIDKNVSVDEIVVFDTGWEYPEMYEHWERIFKLCAELETPEPAEDEVTFWREVFEIHRKVTGTSTKPKTDKQIIKWLKNPHSDSAEYKMWGNGVALPNVIFVLSGISYYSEFT